MTLPRELLIVNATIDPSVEEDWNRWYDEQHLPEIVACPGFRSGQRYVAQQADGVRVYVCIYEIDGPEALESVEFQSRRGWGPFVDRVKFQTLRFSRIAQALK